MKKERAGEPADGDRDGLGGVGELAARREEADIVVPVLRVGLVVQDPLRLLGLQSIVEAARLKGMGGIYAASAVALSPTQLPERSEVAMLLIDASCTDHLLELIATFRRERPLVRMIVLGESADPEYIAHVIGAGAKGYLSQDASEREIWMALEVVNDGSVWAPRKVLARLLERPSSPDGESSYLRKVTFTEREVEVLRLLADGMGNREIAAALRIDESTVKAHLSRLMRKVGAKNRIELMVGALAHRFTEADPVTEE